MDCIDLFCNGYVEVIRDGQYMNDKRALLVIDMQNDYLWEKRKDMFTYDRPKRGAV